MLITKHLVRIIYYHICFPCQELFVDAYVPSGIELDESNLRLVQIFFDTASFDEIERDTEIKLTNQISLVGGTMGLFTGFSIISGIELIYFAAKVFFRSTAPPRKTKSFDQTSKL